MKIILWNIRGAAKESARRHVRDIISLHDPWILVIMEPRISGSHASDFIRRVSHTQGWKQQG